jgi:hypothetical protein
VCLEMLALRVLHTGQLTQRSVGEHHGSRHLRHELLHRLADPPGGVGPERGAASGVVAIEGPRQPDDAFLHQLAAIDRPGAAIDARHAGDQRHEGLDQLAASPGIAVLSRQQQSALESQRDGVVAFTQVRSGANSEGVLRLDIATSCCFRASAPLPAALRPERSGPARADAPV